MVFQRRLDYGFKGYQVPAVPRAPRSARGKIRSRKTYVKNEKHAFEILAKVAGAILQDGEIKEAPSDGTTYEKIPNDVNNKEILLDRVKGQTLPSGMVNNFTGHENTASAETIGDQAVDLPERNLEKSPTFVPSNERGSTMELDMKPSLGRNLEASLSKDWLALGPSSHGGKVQVVNQSDDKSFVKRVVTGTSKDTQIHPDGKNSRIPDLSNSVDWKGARSPKSGSYSKLDGKRKSECINRSNSQTHQQSELIYPFKKRKFLHRTSSSKCEDFDYDEICRSPEKKSKGNDFGTVGVSSSVANEKTPPNSMDCNVKFSIKSFKVPELYIEIPVNATVGSLKVSIKSFKVPELYIEIPVNATVGSLKRRVMEAVTAALGDGLHVGILVQGRRVRDDSKTLIQTGISQDDKHCSLGFMLEPGHKKQIRQPLYSEVSSLQSGDRSQRLSGHKASMNRQHVTSSTSARVPLAVQQSSCVERKLSISSIHDDNSSESPMADSRSMVAVPPPIRMESMAMVPLSRKPARSEFVQRRMRRPFSVSEVEALVEAVEKLGTGRWRDVKLSAFETAKHRTYVDLKDKWKTLVHTARISPQQRRGEPVPQELLDRVLAAHAYWSHHQIKALL